MVADNCLAIRVARSSDSISSVSVTGGYASVLLSSVFMFILSRILFSLILPPRICAVIGL